MLKTDSRNSQAVASALKIDNAEMKDLSVKTKAGEQIVTTVEAKSISKLISTLDDLVACQIAAEKVIGDG
jgi:hypothetical protein